MSECSTIAKKQTQFFLITPLRHLSHDLILRGDFMRNFSIYEDTKPGNRLDINHWIFMSETSETNVQLFSQSRLTDCSLFWVSTGLQFFHNCHFIVINVFSPHIHNLHALFVIELRTAVLLHVRDILTLSWSLTEINNSPSCQFPPY